MVYTTRNYLTCTLFPKAAGLQIPNIAHGISLIFASPTTMYALLLQLTLGSATSESCTERSIVMRQIQNVLWQAGGLNDTPDLHSTLILN